MSEEEAFQKRVADRIKATPAPPTTTSKAAHFRALLPTIEEAMARGVRQADLVAALAEEGLAMSIDELRNALYRERRRKTPRSPNAPSQPAALPAPPPSPPRQNKTAKPNSQTEGFNWQQHRDNKPEW